MPITATQLRIAANVMEKLVAILNEVPVVPQTEVFRAAIQTCIVDLQAMVTAQASAP